MNLWFYNCRIDLCTSLIGVVHKFQILFGGVGELPESLVETFFERVMREPIAFHGK